MPRGTGACRPPGRKGGVPGPELTHVPGNALGIAPRAAGDAAGSSGYASAHVSALAPASAAMRASSPASSRAGPEEDMLPFSNT